MTLVPFSAISNGFYKATGDVAQPVFATSSDRSWRLDDIFKELRDKQDTFKAVYRLSLIGLVDDYVVDYNAPGRIYLKVKKRADSEHLQLFEAYLSRYVAPTGVKTRLGNGGQI
ncbi:MAG: hypothetical protein IPI07_07480 [Flavobacteriales bacterium]|nr:hypothetical protein [Flavobacteriales bacterium]